MLRTLSIALDSTNSYTLDGRSRSASESADGWVDGGSTIPNPSVAMPDLQEIMVDIAAVLLPKSPTDQTLSVINLTMDHHHIYLTLMAKLHPELVYDYLSTHDNYRTEECLRLCEEYDIVDASAYLLERMGKVTNALQLVLQTLKTRMMGLKRTIRSLTSDVIRNHTSRPFTHGNKSRNVSSFPSKHENEVHNVRQILIVALDLCERNSRSLTPANESAPKYKQSELWFSVLVPSFNQCERISTFIERTTRTCQAHG